MRVGMTPSSTTDAGGGEVERFGATFRAARESLGWSIEDVAQALRIRRVYLLALEEGRLQDLPVPAYAVGFVRGYARALGLDAEDMVRRYRALSGPDIARRPDLVFPEPVPERGVPTGALVLVGSILAIIAYVGWYQWSGNTIRTVDTVPPPPQVTVETGSPPGPDPIPGSPPSAANAMPIQPVRPPPVPSSVPSPPAPVIEPPAAQGEARILLRAKSEVWVQVREAGGGRSLVQRVFRPGESFEVPARGGLLSVGNLAGIEVLIDGEPAPGLPSGAGPRRNIALDLDHLRAAPEPEAEVKPKPRPRPRPKPRSDPSDAAYVPPEERGH